MDKRFVKRHLSQKEIAAIRKAFDEVFDGITKRREKAEAAYRRRHGLRKPTIKQLYNTSMRGVSIRSYKNWDRIAWFYPAEAYQADGGGAKRRGPDPYHKLISLLTPEDKSQKRRQSPKPRGRYKERQINEQ